MESILLDGMLGSSLLPTIMSITSAKLYGNDKLDILYLSVTIGTILSTVISSLHFQIRSFKSSRNHLTIMTTTLLTTSLLISISSFHLIRHNFSKTKQYLLPESIRNSVSREPAEVFQKHLHADLIPGFILFAQSLLCLIIRFDLMNRAKRTFTYSESFIVSQLASTVFVIWALVTYTKISGAGPFEVSQTSDVILNIVIVYFTVAFIPSYLSVGCRSTLVRYSLLILATSISFAVTRNIVKKDGIQDPLTWLVQYIFMKHQRISLFSLWLSTLAACVSFSTTWSRLVGQTNSLVRKVFHIAICVVFISGYNQDLDFTTFASEGMIILMIVLEMIRAWNLWPLGVQLEKVCQALRGKWDNRYLTLSHVYLIVGTMMPLWLLPPDVNPSKLALSSGIISVGIGDTAAAIVGTLYGKTDLGLKSGKTMEGLLGNIVAMAIFKLAWVGYSGFADELSFALAAVFTAFAEVISSNCDNLILPLVMLLLCEIF